MAQFEWDSNKALANKLKHGIEFKLAITAFDDPYALIERDERHSTPHEVREILLGESDQGILVVVFTIRDKGNLYRLISARRASRRERELYEEAKRVPF